MQSKTLLTIYNKSLATGHYHTIEKAAKLRYKTIKSWFRNTRNPIGIEIEAEKTYSLNVGTWDLLFWTKQNDGSLKNDGCEYVSLPLIGECIDYAIYEFFQRERIRPVDWSHRCSIHVHVNTSSLYEEDLVALTALYALFEKSFFSLVSEERHNNPYCYPITTLSPKDVKITDNIKYCAFNIGAVKKFCTVEFRHHEGTSDTKKLRRWIRVITKLHRFVEQNRYEETIKAIKSAILKSSYETLAKNIFGVSAVLFKDINNLCKENELWVISYLEQN